ncbi:MAG: LysR family transcriptional regulator [Ilumatobacter sp.]|nr:LysR family transcriptional regulator [Ilumatobacter sp.]
MFMSALRELELRHLVALDAVASEGTFGRAADRLGYTQSAISQQIAALERLVGERVFDRPGGPRPVELTPFGDVVLRHGRELLSRADSMHDELDRFRNGGVGRLTVGTFQSVSSAVLPALVRSMRTRHPDLEIRGRESPDDHELNGLLAAGEVDVSFIGGAPAPEFECRHLLDDPFVLLAQPGRFPDGPVNVSDLVGEPMIGQQPHSCQLLNEGSLRAAGCDPTYVFRSEDNGTVAAMVRSGMGVAILPFLCLEIEDPRLSFHRLEPVLPPRQITLAWRAGRTLSPAAEEFIELADDECSRLAATMSAFT